MRWSIPAILASIGMSGPVAAQHWEVDIAAINITAQGEAYADTCCNNPPPPLGQPCCPRPGPLDFQGLCPPFTWAQVPIGPPAGIARDDNTAVPAGPYSFQGVIVDFGAGSSPTAIDMCPFPAAAVSTADSFVIGDGLGGRTLRIKWWSQIQGEGVGDDDFYTRACTQLTADLTAEAVGLPDAPTHVRYDWSAIGNADSSHECLTPNWVVYCNDLGLPNEEDPETTYLDLEVNLHLGAGPEALVNNVVLDPLAGLPSVFIGDDSLAQPVPAGTATISVDIDMQAGATMEFQAPNNETASADFQGELFLHLIVHDFVPSEPFDEYMRIVPRSGSGPSHAFRVGRYEITNQQYADFLNDAENDAGLTEVSAFMQFEPDGTVTLPDGTIMFRPQNAVSTARIIYAPGAPLGTRYTVQLPTGLDVRTFERHPVVHVTWWGALKFCNWLTIKRGLALSHRCYTEGPNGDNWHPVTTTDADWAVSDLNDVQRLDLVLYYRGFRLPMDNQGSQSGWIGNQTDTFNEWYKAAAYSPVAPATVRADPTGETVPPGHWVFGFGRDVITFDDANFQNNLDPFDNDDAFVGMFDGTHYNPGGGGDVGAGNDFTTAANDNAWAIYDLSGNIGEWGQDQGFFTGQRAVRGGAWSQGPDESAATYRDLAVAPTSRADLGFRVVQSWCPGDVNTSGVVDVVDLLALLAAWGPCGGCAVDLNGDGTVDVQDLLMLLASWGSCA